MVPGDSALARRLHRDARAAARAQLRAELAHARLVHRRERRLSRARVRLPRQAVLALGGTLAAAPLEGTLAVVAGTAAVVGALGVVRSVAVLRSPAPAPVPQLPSAAVPPPPHPSSAAFPAVRRLEAVREELRRLVPLVAPAGREAAEEAWQAAAEADTALRWQAARLAAVEPHRGVEADLLRALEDGVGCQERLVSAVADLVAASADPHASARLQDVTDRLWRGELTIEEVHPFSLVGPVEELADGVAFVPSFANVSALRTDDGLVLVDTGSAPLAQHVHSTVRTWDASPLHTAVYSHGHIDHVFGVPLFAAEAADRGWAAPRVVAHEALPHRFDRYVLTAGYNEVVNQRQFSMPDLRWPREYHYPDTTYRDALQLDVGGLGLQLTHCRGETDDHTWTWVPERKVLCSGDLFIWASPNAGNPQKVQRYAREWAVGLRAMAALGAELLLPGHGVPIAGADRIEQALTDSAELLEHLHDETVAMMNEGARLDDIVHTVKAPQHLLDRPYLRPVYDEPEFVVRNVWRLYGGWWDGDPAHLKPAPASAVAREIADLAGGPERLAERAVELAEAGDLRLAGHLSELAVQAAPGNEVAQQAQASVYAQRAESEASTMAKGVFRWTSEQASRVGRGQA